MIDPAAEGGDLFGELAHQGRQLQQLVGKHVPAQLGPPLGVLGEQPDQVLEVLDGEGHR